MTLVKNRCRLYENQQQLDQILKKHFVLETKIAMKLQKLKKNFFSLVLKIKHKRTINHNTK